jgi:hypothetical protein
MAAIRDVVLDSAALVRETAASDAAPDRDRILRGPGL